MTPNSKLFILRDDTIRFNCLRYLKELSLDGPPLQVEIKPHKKNRSLAQNRLLWLWYTEISHFIRDSTGENYSPEEVHEWFKQRFLPVRPIAINNEIAWARRSTATLKTGEFTEYLEQIDVYCGAALGLHLAHPVGIYEEAVK